MSVPNQKPPTFAALGVAAEICEALSARGIDSTFAIQELTLPIALAGSDLIGQARTGMGKTYAFGIPLLDRVFDDAAVEETDGTPRALVVTPTRELAVQVGEDLRAAAVNLPLRILTLYGGRPYEEQIRELEKAGDVIIGTPGRLLDLARQGKLRLDRVAVLVLDEADEMLDLGFLPDIEKLLKLLGDYPRQTMLFSATMPGPILGLARSFMNKPVRIRAEAGEESQTHAATRKITFQSHKLDKLAVLTRCLQAAGRGRSIVFTRTKRAAAAVADELARRGHAIAAVHGDLGQDARERSLQAFRAGEVEILVATDVAARGIDVEDVTHVFNYQVPDDPLTFVHRIGRTGRAGNSGTAVTLVGYDELAKWQAIDEELSLGQPNPPQWFSTSPELARALDIPADATECVGPPQKVIGATRVREKSPTHTTAVRAGSARHRGQGQGEGRGQRPRSARSRRAGRHR